MSLFEFVTVMVSMILALCLGHLLRNASYLARTSKRVKTYLPHTLWSLVVFLGVINHWWSLWDLRDVDWSYASFVYILIAPILVTFATGLLSPEQTSSDVVDLEAHYLRIRRLFATVYVLYAIVMWFDGPLFAGQAVFGPVGLMHVPIIAAAVLPAFTASRRITAAAAAVEVVVLLGVMALRYSSA
jgi:hypothetical protein